MNRRFTQAVLVLVVVFAAAQLIRPRRANPAIDATRTIGAQSGASDGLAVVLDRACRDCHSNATVWRRYTEIAPASWLMAYAVSEGRKAINFSEWSAYSPDRQRVLLAASCDDVRSGKMPGIYALLHSEMRLSPQDVQMICAAALRAAAPGVSQ